jgi:hypothetical protein
MTTQKNTKINFDTKSQLAKLIATENITIQHNNVKTASFDTVNRILTLPIFKVESGDVYDMLIAHECSHALYTPTDGWKSICDDNELRSYVNVLEDTRIDKLIQKKYPGVVKNYLNGFDIMEKQGFFGTKGKDINTDFMLIDKVNLRSKSSNRLPFIFSKEDQKWLQLVDDLKTFDDVVELAKNMLNWQKKRIESLKKLPDFDSHPITKNYDLNGEEDFIDSDNESQDTMDNNNSNDDAGEEQENSGDKNNESGDDQDDDNEANTFNSNGAGGKAGTDKDKLVAVTEKIFEEEKQKLTDDSTSFNYFNLPEAKLKNVIVSSKDWVNTWKKYQFADTRGDYRKEYINWLKDDYKKFKNDNKKTVMYLVKEFEMKKSATAYKRASTDKTGVIDPLKLKDYKFSDDIFKRLTIVPNEKNHGMMMLLDWSGSMCDVLQNTIEQLMNLVWFCQKINIPYEVYLFTSEMHGSDYSKEKYTYDDKGDKINITSPSWNYKHGDGLFGDFNLINIASHKMKKTELDESLTYLYHAGQYYNERYTRDWRNNYETYKGDRFSIPNEYSLGTTPLNEALVVMNKLVPLYKKKYNIEKMTFITLTDGASNSNYGCDVINNDGTTLRVKSNRSSSNPVITIGRKQYKSEDRFYGRMTNMLLNVLQQEHGINTIGFYVVKRLARTYDLESYIGDYKDWNHKQELIAKLKKSFTKEKMADVKKDGYNRYFILNGKTMAVENTDLTNVNSDMKASKIKAIFSKSMKGRIASRSLLNKFIEEVA